MACRLLLLAALTCAPIGAGVAQTPPRPMTVEDLVKEEVFGGLIPQPSGEWVAVVTHPNWSGYDPVVGSHLTLVSRANGRSLTVGERELQGHWIENVFWSPRGNRLAIVARSLSDGQTLLYVWHAGARTLRRISRAPLGYRVSVGSGAPAEIVWVSDATIVYAELPDSVLATADKSPEDHFRFIAPRMWERFSRGIEPTTHAVESGVVDSMPAHAIATALVAVDSRTGARRVLATTVVPARYRQLNFLLSPRLNGAIARVWDKPAPRRNLAVDINRMWREYVGTMELRPAAAIRWFAHDLDPGAAITWSADGASAVVAGTRFDTKEKMQWTVDGGTLRTARSAAMDSTSSPARPVRPETVRLPEGARTVVDHPPQRITLYTLVTDSGYFAKALDWETRRTTELMGINQYIAGIKGGRRLLIDYRGSDGEPLKGVVLLPPNYQEGRRYPVLTWVYPGSVYRTTNVSQYTISDRPASAANLQVLAAMDYVILLPSIPLPPDSLKRDQLLEIRAPVLAAVDRLVEMGIADPARIAVAGHSNGGYATNVLVTQTNRFRAAITMAGMSNLTSVAGAFDPRFRYTDMAARDGTIQMYWAESGQAGLKASLPNDLWAYLRNSPVFYADKIGTPLLLLHGDQDFVSLSEAEQLFTALYRQGKRARLVRFWGEGHVIGASPANVRQKWYEIFAWLDEFCDIARDGQGRMVFDGTRPKSRAGARPLEPADFARFR